MEALTDAAGKFAVDASPGIDWNPFTYVLKDPWIEIFKPGYGPFPVAHVSTKPVKELKEAFLREGPVVELPRLKAKEELLKFAYPVGIGNCGPDKALGAHCVPDERIPKLMRLINVHRRNLNLQPLPGPFGETRNP